MYRYTFLHSKHSNNNAINYDFRIKIFLNYFLKITKHQMSMGNTKEEQ